MQAKKGVTLLELVVVMFIIATLASITFFSYVHFINSAKIAKAQQIVKSLKIALVQYKREYKTYPPSSDTFDNDFKWQSETSVPDSLFKYLCGDISQYKRGYEMDQYMDATDIDDKGRMLDPWGNPIMFQNNIEDRKKKNLPYTQPYVLTSFGPNGEDDRGEGDDISVIYKFGK